MTSAPFDVISKHRCFGGTVGFYKHTSATNACVMKFSVFTPPQAERGKVPVLYYLAGLTCTEETFMTKAGAQRRASELGLMLVAPDTSPRGVPLPGDSESWDFGVGAGFYVDATQSPWSKHYKMYSYVTSGVAGDHRRAFPGRSGSHGHFRAFDGRAWRAHHRAEESRRALSLDLGVRADLRAEAGAVGREGVHELSRQRSEYVGCV